MIEVVSKENLKEVLPLIRAYQEFYGVSEIADCKNEKFFSEFGEPASTGCQFCFRDNGKIIAFATVYFSFTSTIASKVAVLNDLYTLPDYRNKGIARQLIEYCKSYAANNNAVRLQWVTAQDNEEAQKLYDSMDTKKSSWYFYTYNI